MRGFPNPTGVLNRSGSRDPTLIERLFTEKPLKVLVANPRGFCAGVNMAVESLERALEIFGPPVYLYHEIVHNKHVVERFKKEGAIFVDHLSEVPANSVVLFSAHGVAPAIRAEAAQRNLRAIDATCPLVTKVHLEAIRFAKNGYHIVLIGHTGHDEVVGTMGEAPEAMTLVETLGDVEALVFPDDVPLAYLTQTTLSVDDTRIIIERLRQRFPRITGPNREDICYATSNRQEAVRLLAPRAEVVLVLGSQNSSNSQRLQEIGVSLGKRSYLIDSYKEIQDSWLEPSDTVLVTAGASAPEKVVQGCIDYLRERFGGSVESVSIREENVRFALPKELRRPAPQPV